MSKIILAVLLLALLMNIVTVDCGALKRPYLPKPYNDRQRRMKEPLPFDTAEMNLSAANELMDDILKDVDLLMDELQLIEAARKEVRLTR